MTRTFETLAAQGDIALRRIDALPEGLRPIAAENGKHILAHSETGHHHTVLERPDVKHFSAMDEFRSFLVVEGDPVDLVHERAFDTHETLRINPGIYEVRRQREYVPDGFRRAAD